MSKYERFIIEEGRPQMRGHLVNDETLKEPTPPPVMQFKTPEGQLVNVSVDWFQPPKVDLLRAAVQHEYAGRAVSELVLCQLAYKLETDEAYRDLVAPKPEYHLADLFKDWTPDEEPVKEEADIEKISGWF